MSHKPEQDEMRPEYDFTGGVRGKHHEAYRQGTNVVLLDPEVARVFRDSSEPRTIGVECQVPSGR